MDKVAEWKDRFISLYISDEPGDYENAFDLKQQKMPQRLYRYRSIKNGIDFARLVKAMRDGQIYCAHRNTLNDPFEMRSPLSSKSVSSYFGNVEHLRRVYRTQLKAHFSDTELDEALQGEDWFKKVSQLIFTGKEGHSGIPADQVLDKVIMLELEKLKASYESLFDMIKIASFSENCTSLSMWAHYADNHCGVCLAFDVDKLNESVRKDIFPVTYVEELPDVLKFTFEKLQLRGRLPSWLVPYHCIHKLNHWGYEQEWRYLSQGESDAIGKGIETSFIKPSKIMFGSNVAEDIKNELCKVAHKEGIAVAQMRVTPYGLEEDCV